MKIGGDTPLISPFDDRASSQRVSSGSESLSGKVVESVKSNEIIQSGTVASAVSVSVSSESLDLSQRVQDQPEIRVDLVNDLKAKIANGTYNISPSIIATAMVESAVSSL